MENTNLVEYGSAGKGWWEFTQEDVNTASGKMLKGYAREHGQRARPYTT